MSSDQEIAEAILVHAIEKEIDVAKSDGEKVVLNLFKALLLKKYVDEGNLEIQAGRILLKTLDKAADAVMAYGYSMIWNSGLDSVLKKTWVDYVQKRSGDIKLQAVMILKANGIIVE